MKKIPVILLAVLAASACKKHKPGAPAPKDNDTLALVKKIAGPHRWNGTYSTYRYIDSLNKYDTNIHNISFECPIERFGSDSIYFDSGATNTKTMGITHVTKNIIQFDRRYFPTMYTYEDAMLLYNVQKDTIYYTRSFTTNTYSDVLEVRSP